VYVADDADVAQALRMDTYLYSATPTAIPVGLYTSAGRDAPALPRRRLPARPRGVRTSISGMSGLATKTSAVEFLLASIFAHFPAHKGRVAALCFNVKGPDLCFLDQPGDLSDEDRKRYERLGVPSTPSNACGSTRRSRRMASTSTRCARTPISSATWSR